MRNSLFFIAGAIALTSAAPSVAAISDEAVMRGIAESMASVDPDLPYDRSSHLLRPVPNDTECTDSGFCHYLDSRGVHYTYVADERSNDLAAITIDVTRWKARELPALGLRALRGKQAVIAQTNRFTHRTLRCQGQTCSIPLGPDGGLALRFSARGQLEEITLMRWNYT